MPSCAACHQALGRDQFSLNQLSKGADRRRCKSCVAGGAVPALGAAPAGAAPSTVSEDMPFWQIMEVAARESGVTFTTSTPMGSGYVWRALRADEDPATWLHARAPAAALGVERALEMGSAEANEFIHCTTCPHAAVYYAAALRSGRTLARVVRIDLCQVAASSVIDVSDMQKCIGHGLHPRSLASLFAAGHKVVLLSETVRPEAISVVYDLAQFIDLPRNQHRCSLADYTQQLPKCLREEVERWSPPATVKDLPQWHDIAAMPLRYLWRAENALQAEQDGPTFVLLATGEFEYFPARFAECIMDELDQEQRGWLIDHGIPRQTRVWCEHTEQWVQLHPEGRPSVAEDVAIVPAWYQDPTFGALHANMAVFFHVSMIITRCWPDGESRARHVSRKCGPYETESPWGTEFIAGCRFLEEMYAERNIVVKIRTAAVRATRGLGLACNLDPHADGGWDEPLARFEV